MSSLPYRQLRKPAERKTRFLYRLLPYRQIKCEKKLVLSYELFFEYGGEGGIDSLRSPCGQPTHCVRGLSNWLRQLSNPGRGFSSPLECNMRKKSSHFRTSSSLNMAVRGGLTRFARPAGSPLTVFVVCPTGCASCRTPVGASHPPWSAICEKKARTFVRALL